MQQLQGYKLLKHEDNIAQKLLEVVKRAYDKEYYSNQKKKYGLSSFWLLKTSILDDGSFVSLVWYNDAWFRFMPETTRF